MGHEWKIGDWAEYNGKRYFVVKVTELGVWAVGEDVYKEAISPDKRDRLLKHLPECTGWDWKPPVVTQAFMEAANIEAESGCCTGPSELPALLPGYRYLERYERVVEGDICIHRAPAGNKYDWRTVGGKSIGCTAGYRMDHYGVVCFARKIEPRYRPFANAAEFAQLGYKWVMNWSGDNPSYRKMITEFDDDGVWEGDDCISWEDMARRYRFEDGTPFGVLETEKQQ